MGAAGCSSLPKKAEPRSLVFANMKMRLAGEAQLNREYERAAVFYKQAYDYFTRIDDIKGKIEAALSMARQYFYLGRSGKREQWLNRAAGLIDNNMPAMAGAKTILSMEMAFWEGKYKKVIDLGEGQVAGNREWRMEMLCYVLASKAKSGLDYQAEFNKMPALLRELEKARKKRRIEDPGVLSMAYYYMGYIYSVEKNWQEAAGYFEKAKIIDGEMDNTYGLGKDLYALARCHEKLGLTARAMDGYRRAAEIFRLLKDDEMLEKIEKRLEAGNR
jgi:tetratricopeptide (TPR) repeat protein